MWQGIDAGRLLARSRQFTTHSVFASSFNLESAGRLLHISESRPAAVALRSPFGIEVDAVRYARMRAGLGEIGATWRWEAEYRTATTPAGHRVQFAPVSTNAPAPPYLRDPGVVLDRLGDVDALIGSTGLAPYTAARELGARMGEAIREWSEGSIDSTTWFVGRGPGLTPSGDDMLVGALAASTQFTETAFSRARSRLALLLERDGGRLTTQVAREYLLSACRGRFAGPVQRLQSARHDTLGGAARALRDFGHSSGTDTLAGYAIAMRHFAVTLPV